MTALLPVAEAQARLLAMATPLPVETVALCDAHGRSAAADIVAVRTQPYADLSAMDGYAIRFADLPGPFRLIGESAAGRPFAGPIGRCEATRIFTGAAMPDGADCVLVQEEAERAGDRVDLVGEGPLRISGNVRRRGLDFVAGDVLVSRGERLTAARLAVCAIGGIGTTAVHRTVRVTIAATGDELAPIGSADADRLPESNSLMLAAQLAGMPAVTTQLGALPDDLDALAAAFGATESDVLVTTGGASVGDHDLVRPALEAAGGAVDFWRIGLRPGKPMLAGRLPQGTILVALPGNPVSAFVTCELFVKPLIATLAGARDPLPPVWRVPLGEPLPANGSRSDYLRAQMRDGLAYVAPIQDSSMLRTLARSSCLVVRPPHAPPAQAGDLTEVIAVA